MRINAKRLRDAVTTIAAAKEQLLDIDVSSIEASAEHLRKTLNAGSYKTSRKMKKLASCLNDISNKQREFFALEKAVKVSLLKDIKKIETEELAKQTSSTKQKQDNVTFD